MSCKTSMQRPRLHKHRQAECKAAQRGDLGAAVTLTFRLGSQVEDESQQVYTKLTEPDQESRK